MRHLARDILTAILAWLAVEGIKRFVGGIMIQGWLLSIWHKFPFEIVTLSMTIVILVCVEYYKIFRLGMREYDRQEHEKQQKFEEFKSKFEEFRNATNETLRDLNEKYTQLLLLMRGK